MNQRRSIAEINIVPYVDVMLVLVVILMVTAPLMTQGVQVDLPQAQANPLSPDHDLPVVVSVTANGDLFLNIAANPTEPMPALNLQHEVAAALVRNPKRAVVVKGDKAASYELIVQAMVLLQQSGVPSVGLETSDPGLT